MIPDWKVSLNLSGINRKTHDERCKTNEENGESGDKYYESELFANSELKVMENKAFIENENVRIDYTNNNHKDFGIFNTCAATKLVYLLEHVVKINNIYNELHKIIKPKE